jgi:hypothetical protein
MTSSNDQIRARPDYSRWTIEELRQLALRLRIRDAGVKSRRELVELFDVPARKSAEERRPQ